MLFNVFWVFRIFIFQNSWACVAPNDQSGEEITVDSIGCLAACCCLASWPPLRCCTSNFSWLDLFPVTKMVWSGYYLQLGCLVKVSVLFRDRDGLVKLPFFSGHSQLTFHLSCFATRQSTSKTTSRSEIRQKKTITHQSEKCKSQPCDGRFPKRYLKI